MTGSDLTMMTSSPLYRAADLRRIEAAAVPLPLMQRAGLAAADLAGALCRDRGNPILILAGPGNNGGDAFEAAYLLRQRFFEVHVVFPGQPSGLPQDAAQACARFRQNHGVCLSAIPQDTRWSLIIDGLFGIGLTRAIAEPYTKLIEQANALARRDGCPVLALDCPSGLDADTGKLHGATIKATHTLTFISGKPGLYTADGPDHCGTVRIAPLDLDAPTFPAPQGRTVGLDLFSAQLKPRLRNSHKGSHGSAGILGGDRSMVGAALLAARAALRLGSGRVYLGLLDPNAPALDPLQPELMLRTPEKLLSTELDVLACGPGMGDTPDALSLLTRACSLGVPLVLDADALNLLASEKMFQSWLTSRQLSLILTPHPAEAARLLGCDTTTVQADRLAAALQIATRFKAFVALKGCGTVVATPDGHWFINTSGNPGLATAGSGDVLTGFITALLAQGWPPLEALLAAVHLHGTAAEQLATQGAGPIGLTAGELIDSARYNLNQWVARGAAE